VATSGRLKRVLAKSKAPSPAKAEEMLKNPPHGKPLTGKQKRFFGGLAHGMKPRGVKPSAASPPKRGSLYDQYLWSKNKQIAQAL
jgi:hypothetical protein